MLKILSLMGISLVMVPAVVGAGEGQESSGVKGRRVESPIACRLSPRALSRRTEEFGKIFTGDTPRKELEDGYAFRFAGDGGQAERLLALIQAERECCPFFTFEMTFEPDQGPIWLSVRGSEEVKAFLESLMK